MSIEFKLPAVGENIDKAEIGSLKVAVGDMITADQVVMEIETDKAVFELPCPHAGKITKIHVKSGDSVAAGATLLTIEESAGGESAKPARAAAAPAAKAEAAPAPAKAPAKTAKTPAPAPAAPPVAAPTPRAAPKPATPAAPAAESTGAPPEDGEGAPAPAGPATRRLARELGVDLHRVTGTGPGGRITSEDVQAFVREKLAALDAEHPPTEHAAGARFVPPLPDFSQFGPVERQALNKIARTAAANLSLSWNVVPHVTQHELADVTDLEAARKRYSQGPGSKEGAPKVTMTVLAMKAVVIALKAFPKFNASYDVAREEVVLKQYYNIGVAVDTENGLMVPVIRAVDTKSVVQLAAELTDLAKKARDRKLTPADMQGGSFTITNLGGIGGTYFTPIVNYPEVAILGMSRSSQQQVIIAGAPQVRLMLPLSLSYDHRVINGADAARFIVKLSELLSDPFHLMSEV
ncbi:MAG: 2-oxo acid dehydrogenase subunit E2 [Planctomycetia bacterium]|nr:2-oxo acid dehydrogenase subunit E2 [Planctomycetia bacterium]